QAAEMLVDRFERSEQALAAFAIERADAAAQAMYGLSELVALLCAGSGALRQFGQFAFGDEIDRADALALRDQAIMRGGFILRMAHGRCFEAGAIGQQRWRAFEALARQAPHFDAAHFL